MTVYTPLESISNNLVPNTPTLGAIFSVIWPYLWQILIVTVMGAFAYAAFKYFLSAGSLRDVKDGKEIAFRAAGGLLVAVTIFLFLNEFAPAIVNFSGLALSGRSSTGTTTLSIASPSTPTRGTPELPYSVGGVSCADPNTLSTALNAGRGICSLASCQKAKCALTPEIKSAIVDASSKAGVDWRYIAAIACRESSGNPTLVSTLAQNGKPDCGLMQINSDSCTPDIMDLQKNISLGIQKFKSNITSLPAVTSSYKNISKETMAFASYNCCATEGNPNNVSVDCNKSAGFNTPIPKWACPINPGTGTFNMCAVRDYACDITACANLFTN